MLSNPGPIRSLTTPVLLLATCSTALAGGGATWVLGGATELLPPDGATTDRSGEAVATDGDVVVVGAPLHDHAGFVDQGAVYVYRRTTGGLALEAELSPDVAANSLEFGRSVDIDGDTLVVGSPRDDALCGGTFFCDSGVVYVFAFDGTSWSQQAKLSPTDLEDADRFGQSVRIHGDTLVAGSPGDRDAGSGTGSAYVFTRTGAVWSETQKLLASDLATRSEFGASLSLDGDLLLVGAPLDDQGQGWSINYGAAYAFRLSGGSWVEEAKLRANDAFAGMEFGRSVSVQGSLALAGAPGANAPLTASGAAYVFEHVGASWTQRQKVTAAGAGQGDRFGTSTSMLGDSFVVGSAPEVSGAGTAEAFRRSGSSWERFLVLTSDDASPFDRFGVSVRLGSDYLVVGARGHTHSGGPVDAGAAYAYERLPMFEAYCDALPNSTGLPAVLSGSGSSSLALNDLVLTARDMPPTSAALLIYGAGQTEVPLGDGRLCVSGPFFRLNPVGSSDGSGSFVRAIDYTRPPMGSGPGAITAGSSWNFQCWFRDTTQGGFNFSNGLRVTFTD